MCFAQRKGSRDFMEVAPGAARLRLGEFEFGTFAITTRYIYFSGPCCLCCACLLYMTGSVKASGLQR